jgi:hypothetical protein
MTRQRKQRELEEAKKPSGAEFAISSMKPERRDRTPFIFRTRLYDGHLDTIENAESVLRNYVDQDFGDNLVKLLDATGYHMSSSRGEVFSDNDILYLVVYGEFEVYKDDFDIEDVEIPSWDKDFLKKLSRQSGLPTFKNPWRA